MSVFDLDREIVAEYERFARSFTKIRADDLLEQIDSAYQSGRFWPEPMIQINPSFKRGESISDPAQAGDLHRGVEDLFCAGKPFNLYRHQTDAVELANCGKSFLVTTGTGSGKSLCYFLPIINHVLKTKTPGAERRTRAIVIYPMNALANSQTEEFDKRLKDTA